MSSLNAANAAQRSQAKSIPDADDESAVLAGLEIPEPVFFCSVEPASLSHQLALENALYCLSREDPSLRVHTDPDTGQMVLSGMGELHLEVIHERLRSEYKVEADLGPLQIAYRETISAPHREAYTLDRVIGERRHVVTIALSVQPHVEAHAQKQISLAPDKTSDFSKWLQRRHMTAINSGLQSALSRGTVYWLLR